jgi:7,8-dihydropterin-6-yl-methyl-4-(beta-D-ribofuranosyl)aminobenzene 5'-phosphate synthase
MKVTCAVDDQVCEGAGLRAEHGISFVIETGENRVLFDTGQTGSVLLSNLSNLGFVPSQLDAIVLSHAHNDHVGGLEGLLGSVTGIPLYAHPTLFRPRYRVKDGAYEKVGPCFRQDWLESHVQLHLRAEPLEVVPGVWTSGAIATRTEPEGSSPTHKVQQGEGWMPDPYEDDQSLVLKTEQGLVLLCGCCHAGLLNVLAQVRHVFGADPVAAVGGIHLVNADKSQLGYVVEKLLGHGPPQMWLGHCTGQAAFRFLVEAFGGSVRPCQAGTMLNF